MPVNRNALIRYRTLDNCLRNRARKWTLQDLIDACSEALYEYEGIDKGVSKRSVQMDLQMMRSDKLGYNAPIVVLAKKYYTYEDPDYSITNIPLTDQDLGKLTEVVEILKQFKGFSHFQELSGMVQRLENKIHSEKTKQEPVIDFEKNENLKGLEHIETIYKAIIDKQTVELSYQSFKARSANSFVLHPYYLKEYRNRWFVLGVKNKNAPIMTLALDRIAEIKESSVKYVERKFQVGEYFQHVIGVTVEPNRPPEEVVLFADRETAPYIITKPLHHSQRILDTQPGGITLSIQVQLNFELERELLGFGDRIKVISPDRLKRRIKEKFEHALDLYQYEFSNSSFPSMLKKLEHKGFAILRHVYSRKEINQMKNLIHLYYAKFPNKELYAIRALLTEIPEMRELIYNENLIRILKRVNPELYLTKAVFFDKTPESNWYVTWHQDTTINLQSRIDLSGYTGWTKKEGFYGVNPPDEILRNTLTIRIHLDDTDESNGALKVIPGSQNKKLSDSEIQVIVQNSIPFFCELDAGGIHLMRPLLLHASAKSTNQKHRRVLHLEFSSSVLPNGLKWAEQLSERA